MTHGEVFAAAIAAISAAPDSKACARIFLEAPYKTDAFARGEVDLRYVERDPGSTGRRRCSRRRTAPTRSRSRCLVLVVTSAESCTAARVRILRRSYCFRGGDARIRSASEPRVSRG